MPNTPVVPLKPVNTVKVPPPQAAPPASKSPLSYTGVKVKNGGYRETHTSNVIDNSKDKTQFLPFIANCLTCGWQARVKDREAAESLAKGHVGA